LRRADDLAARLPEHEAVLARLAAEARTDGGAVRFASDADQFKHDTIARLVAGLRDLTARGGPIERVRGRHAFASTVREATIVAHQAAWDEAIRSIGDTTASPAYRGLRLKPQLGLVPIGKDPRSGLWEFAHLETADRAREPVPVRGRDGRLAVTEATGLVFVLLPAGSFRMGAVRPDDETKPTEPNVDPGARPEEGPVTEVRLDAFFVSKYEMTQGQWLRMAGANPSHYHVGAAFGDTVVDLRNPVELVSAEDCESWMKRLGLHVPTEAQWEYAARGGVMAPRWTGIDPAALEHAANLADQTCRENGGHPSWPYVAWSDGYTIHAPVGSFAPNPFGLHDVLGNVQEICRDLFCDYEVPPALGDGLRTVPAAPDKRMVRGGAFNSGLDEARSAGRNSASAHFRNDSLGLRPVRMIIGADP
jgi:formylglycine-generating enzyme required for sulfatase activity